eukprot:TRINITY_DN5521_c0_g1_i1.p1 TRINITY_DN5521_c0_g1~~TRINITY_DN5521_c0_g1_i1.p1  ORF type:complete len:619 (-),score=69.26 TRINITY_DN5521_c0_g1_i1:108-1913(-)
MASIVQQKLSLAVARPHQPFHHSCHPCSSTHVKLCLQQQQQQPTGVVQLCRSNSHSVVLYTWSAILCVSSLRRRTRSRAVGSPRRVTSVVVRKSLCDDVSLAVDELFNTTEDVALHLSRLRPWLVRPTESSSNANISGQGGQRRIVVLGTGWAAHAIVKVVDVSSVDICVVSPRNYFIFTPMLAAASVGSVEYRSILEHIRSANPTVSYLQGTCTGVDVTNREIRVCPGADGIGEEFTVPYDVLVVAVGLRPSSLGVPGVDQHCLFLKSVEDARGLRKRVTENFERADLPTADDAQRQRLLTFVVVGGGPTGCEFCGELSDFVRNDLRRFYPALASLVRIMLFHRGTEILPSFGETLQTNARDALKSQGIEIFTSAKVVAIDEHKLHVTRPGMNGETQEEQIDYGLCLWAAGQGGQDLVRDLCQQIPRQQEIAEREGQISHNQMFVDEWLRVIGVPDGSVLALGDCARSANGEERLPQTAQVAAQQGAYVARLLNRQYDLSASPPRLQQGAKLMQFTRARGRSEAPAFRFLDLGQLAYLGQENAVAELGLGSTTVSQAKGLAAFLLWRSVYLVKQVSFRNRVLVLFDWMKSRLFGRDLTRF